MDKQDEPKVVQNATREEMIDRARHAYLRVFCDVWFPQIVAKAVEKDSNAIWLLIFSARRELQTPTHSELGVPDYWQAMLALEPTIAIE